MPRKLRNKNLFKKSGTFNDLWVKKNVCVHKGSMKGRKEEEGRKKKKL